MHLANQRPGKPDKLSQGAHNKTSYPKIQWEDTLGKRGTTESQGNDNTCREREAESKSRGEHKVKEQEQEHMTTHAAGS